MRAREFLYEDQTLSPDKLTKDMVRFNNLVNNIAGLKPLYLQDGTPVIIKPEEAQRIKDLQANGEFSGRIKLTGQDNKPYALSSFLKTAEYGGQAIPPGQEATTAPTKEGAKLKPSDIGLHDRKIKASNLGKEIIGNQDLQGSEQGKVVIGLAGQISSGETPTIPKGQDPAIIKAINDYAGEYLGVWALINERTDFPNKDKFLEWLNMPLMDLVLEFPGKSGNPLADSYALIDPKSGHQINISSKGKGGGAPPAISGLKIPDHVREKPQYAFAVKFVELMQNTALPKPTTVSQAFQAMNLINQFNPDAVPEKWKPFLPWEQSIIALYNDSRKARTPLPKYQSLWQDIAFQKDNATDAGKLVHAIKTAVKDIVNSGGISEFEAAIIEILDYNFIQQDTKLRTNGQMYFKTNWPARINGRVTVETKSGATDPTKGSFSFKLHFD